MIFKNLRIPRLILISFLVYFFIAGYGVFAFQYVFIENNPIFFQMSIFWVIASTIGLPIYWEKKIIKTIEIIDDQVIITRLLGIKRINLLRDEINEARYLPKHKSLNIKIKDKFMSFSFEPDSDIYSWIETTPWREIFIPPTLKRHESGFTKDGMIWSTVCFFMALFMISITIIFRDRILSQEFRYQLYVGSQIIVFTIFIFIVSFVMLSVGRYSVELKRDYIEFSGMPWDSSQNRLFTLEEIRYGTLNQVNVAEYQDYLIFGWGKYNHWVHLEILTKEGDTNSILFTPKNAEEFIHDLCGIYGKDKVFEL